MIHSRVAAFTVSLAIGAVALAGCSGSSGSSASSAPSSSASSSPSAAEQPNSLTGAEISERMLAAILKAKTVKVTTTAASTVPAATADVAYTGSSANTKTTMSLQGQDVEVITIDNGAQIYLKSAGLQVPTWTLVESSSSNPVVKSMAAVLSSMKSSLDPSAGLRMYAKADDFKKVGTTTLDGVQTTQYTGSIPLSAVTEALGALGTSVPTEGAEPITVDIYLDKDDRPIKVVQTGTLAGQPLDSTVTYSDYGAPLTVEAPTVGS